MSIASEITALQTNLTAAKTAVTTKGGTVTDSGLAGLASEIASIPSGGSLANYGSITYLDENNAEQTLTLANEEDFIELSVGGSSSVITINNTSINKNNIISVTIAEGVAYLPNNFCYGCNNLTSATLPSSLHYIGDSVLNATSLNNELNLSNVRYVGTSFLGSVTSFNKPISLPKVEIIESNFLSNCTSFNSSLTINDNARIIKQRFLYGCTAFAQPFSVPSGIEMNIEGYFLGGCPQFTGPLTCNTDKITANINTLSTGNASAPMYVTGVTLTGTYAQAWKDALPDRTTSPYRKLIVGS